MGKKGNRTCNPKRYGRQSRYTYATVTKMGALVERRGAGATASLITHAVILRRKLPNSTAL